jgi:capsular exopolysaccharide synthesis family protein
MQQVNFEGLRSLDYKSNEAYKSLRTNIRFCGSDVNVICFTSSIPNEGKSNVSFQLAMSIAESEKKVLFLDADLRKSVIIGRYKPGTAVNGLTQYLTGQSELNEVIYETNVEHMDIIFTGPIPPNPAELLGSTAFTEMLQQLRKEYDYIVIDTPPLGSVIDSVVVAEQCDGVVFVIEAGVISYKLALKVKEQLQKGKVRILGVVLNKVNTKLGEYKYYGRKYMKYQKEYYISS